MTEQSNKDVQLFVTCLVDQFFPDVGWSTVEVLERLGCTVAVPTQQTCCGQPAFNGGFWDDASKMGKYTLDVLSQTNGPIVIPSGSCAAMIVHHYVELFEKDPVYGPKAQEVASRTYELTQYLVDVLGVTDVKAKCSACVTYHSSCHGLRGLGIEAQPAQLLENVDNLEVRALQDTRSCCGFGGLFAVKMSEISGAIMQEKLDNIKASGADVVIGTDVSCLMHIGGGLRKQGIDVKTKHIAEILRGDNGA